MGAFHIHVTGHVITVAATTPFKLWKPPHPHSAFIPYTFSEIQFPPPRLSCISGVFFFSEIFTEIWTDPYFTENGLIWTME